MIQFSFSKKEIKDIIYSTLAIGFVFAWGNNFTILKFIIMSIIVALSFIPHELAHKYVATKYNCFAEYQMWKIGLIIAIVMVVVLGFTFIAPGAVVIYSSYHDRYGMRHVNLTSKQNAFISAAGPATNLLVALLFLPLAGINAIFYTIVYINSFLALFNLLPIPPLDGSKIIWYNILLWAAMIGVGLLLISILGPIASVG
jgi:Zn-dependent protease